MRASSLTSLKRCWVVTDWLWWRLPWHVRVYVGIPPIAAVVVIAIAAANTERGGADAATFLLLLFCGTISVVSTPRMMYGAGGLNRDFSSIWVLPIAILLPPV